MKYILFFFLIAFVVACNNVPKNKAEIKKDLLETTTINVNKEKEIHPIDSSKIAKIAYDEFTLTIWGVEIYKKQLNSIDAFVSHQDSNDIWLEFENTPSAKFVSFLPSSLQITKVLQRYRTSLIIKNQDTFLALSDWKHYESNFDTLDIEKTGFYMNEYTESDILNFPVFEIDELKQYVKLVGGNDWLQILTHSNLRRESIFDFIIDQVDIYIEFINENGEIKEKQICFKLQYKGKV